MALGRSFQSFRGEESVDTGSKEPWPVSDKCSHQSSNHPRRHSLGVQARQMLSIPGHRTHKQINFTSLMSRPLEWHREKSEQLQQAYIDHWPPTTGHQSDSWHRGAGESESILWWTNASENEGDTCIHLGCRRLIKSTRRSHWRLHRALCTEVTLLSSLRSFECLVTLAERKCRSHSPSETRKVTAKVMYSLVSLLCLLAVDFIFRSRCPGPCRR